MIPTPSHPTVGTPYGRPGTMWAAGHHTGVDFPAPQGTRVVATSPGRVTFESWGRAYGYHPLVVHHPDGTRHLYAHLSGRTVTDGQHVKAGDQLGYVGSEGNVTGPHLHYEVRRSPFGYGNDIDPMPYVHAHLEEEDDMPLTDADIDKIAKATADAVNRVLGDYNANGTPIGPNKDDPQPAAVYIRQIKRLASRAARR